MQVNREDFEKLRELEESTWKPETRLDSSYMSKILAPDFFEFSPSGKRYNKENVLSIIFQVKITAKLPLGDFKVTLLGSDVFLVTYSVEVVSDKRELSYRSSIWLKTPMGWELKFHQGTLVTE